MTTTTHTRTTTRTRTTTDTGSTRTRTTTDTRTTDTGTTTWVRTTTDTRTTTRVPEAPPEVKGPPVAPETTAAPEPPAAPEPQVDAASPRSVSPTADALLAALWDRYVPRSGPHSKPYADWLLSIEPGIQAVREGKGEVVPRWGKRPVPLSEYIDKVLTEIPCPTAHDRRARAARAKQARRSRAA